MLTALNEDTVENIKISITAVNGVVEFAGTLQSQACAFTRNMVCANTAVCARKHGVYTQTQCVCLLVDR